MPQTITYPKTPQSPRFLLKLSLSGAMQSTSLLLATSVLGVWIIALLGYMVGQHMDSGNSKTVIFYLLWLLLLLVCTLGVIQCHKAYQEQPVSEAKTLTIFLQKLPKLLLTLCFIVASLALLVWINGTLLEMLLPHGGIMLGALRVLTGFAYIFLLATFFLILPWQIMSDSKLVQIVRQLLQVATKHWLRCFLCMFAWLIVIDVLMGNLAIMALPVLKDIAYMPLVIISVVSVLVVPVMISYTTLLVHDLMLRGTQHLTD